MLDSTNLARVYIYVEYDVLNLRVVPSENGAIIHLERIDETGVDSTFIMNDADSGCYILKYWLIGYDIIHKMRVPRN